MTAQPWALGSQTLALARAKRLREIGLSYTAIAAVMAEDFGLAYSHYYWRAVLVGSCGVPVKVLNHHARQRTAA